MRSDAIAQFAGSFTRGRGLQVAPDTPEVRPTENHRPISHVLEYVRKRVPDCLVDLQPRCRAGFSLIAEAVSVNAATTSIRDVRFQSETGPINYRAGGNKVRPALSLPAPRAPHAMRSPLASTPTASRERRTENEVHEHAHQCHRAQDSNDHAGPDAFYEQAGDSERDQATHSPRTEKDKCRAPSVRSCPLDRGRNSRDHPCDDHECCRAHTQRPQHDGADLHTFH